MQLKKYKGAESNMIIEKYEDKKNGETYFVDSSTIERMNIKKLEVNIMSVGKRSVNINTKYFPLKKEVKIISKINVRNKDYLGESDEVDSLTFCNAIAQSIIDDKNIETIPLIKSMTTQACSDLLCSLASDGLIINGSDICGVGFIMSKGKKIAVFENLLIGEYESNKVAIKKCVSTFDISLTESCSLIFYSKNFSISAEIEEVSHVNFRRVSSYSFSVSNLKVLKTPGIAHALEKIEGDIDRFVENRISLLDDITNTLDVDDLFEDIF